MNSQLLKISVYNTLFSVNLKINFLFFLPQLQFGKTFFFLIC